MTEQVEALFPEQITQLLTISRELFDGGQTDAAFYALKAAAAVYGTAQTDAVLGEARYQLAHRDNVQMRGAIDVMPSDYVQLLHEVKTRDEFVARYFDYLKQHGMSDDLLEQEEM